MKRLAIILAAMCAFALCFALVGCGGNKDQAAPADDQAATEATEATEAAAPDVAAPDAAAEAEPAAEDPFVGDWDVYALGEEGAEDSVTHEDLELLKESGIDLDTYMRLNADGSATLVTMGIDVLDSIGADGLTSSWEATGATTANFIITDGTKTMTLPMEIGADGLLTFTLDDGEGNVTVMIFEKK